MIHSVILMGQSNMSGRGNFGEVEPIFDERIQVLRCGKWRTMRGPVNPEDHKCEVSLAESFAASYAADHPEDMVGLVPCSFCGSSLDQWAPGELLYDHAVAMTKLAQRTSTVVAILWHQGETLNQILSERTGQPLERIQMDTERDNFMSSMEAKEYGLIDEVITKRP